MAHNRKLEAADVVAAFDNQDDAEEAVLGLRAAGFRDDEFGYLARNMRGVVTDFVGRTYIAAGTVLGIIAGVGLGWWAAVWVLDGSATPLAPAIGPGIEGVYITNIVCGAILTAMVGALCGWGVWRGEAVHLGSEIPTGGYVIAVHAGDRRDAAWAVLRRHGGHEAPRPHDATAPIPGGLPT